MLRRSAVLTFGALLVTLSILLSAAFISGSSPLQIWHDRKWPFLTHKPLSDPDPTSSTNGTNDAKPTIVRPEVPLPTKDLNATLLAASAPYVKAIFDLSDTTYPRLECPKPTGTRYNHLQPSHSKLPKYFFALDLHQIAPLLPRLIGSIIETIKFLGPTNCALSIVEGRSNDGTYEILYSLTSYLKKMGVDYHLQTSTLNPTQGARIDILAQLRNLALAPLTSTPDAYAEDIKVIFLNDVSLCMEDILELLHQHKTQEADMVCAMDWTYVGEHPTFYDVWISRTLSGETFFNIPPDGNWNSAWNLFWADAETARRFSEHKPFQVFSCWNGAVVFDGDLVTGKDGEEGTRFRGSKEGECFRGEPELFAKELWKRGRGKIAVVPSVNLEYSDADAKRIKALKGYTSQWVEPHGADTEAMKIDWVQDPPEKVKCMPNYQNQTWVPWDEGL